MILSCNQPRRIEPLNREPQYSIPIIGNISDQFISSVDSNQNGVVSGFVFNLQVNFRNRGIFSYEIIYSTRDDYYTYEKKLWKSKSNILVNEGLSYSENIFIDADSILKINKLKSSTISIYIKFKNQYGDVINIPGTSSNPVSTTEYNAQYKSIETTSEDRKNYIRSFDFNINEYDNKFDVNRNSYIQLPSKLGITFNSYPNTSNSYYALLKYRTSYNDPYSTLAEIKEFTTTNGSDLEKTYTVHYLIDTNKFEKGDYSLQLELYDSKSKELLRSTGNSVRFEKYSDDTRRFNLDKFELTDSTDKDKDSFASVYTALLHISSSDKTPKKYFAKVMYSNYGKENYEQLVPLIINCDQDNYVLITGGSLLSKGFYDLSIDLYDFNTSTNTSVGTPIKSWKPFENKKLQAISIEKIAEDVP